MMANKWFYYCGLFSYVAFLVYFSLQSPAHVNERYSLFNFAGADKIKHFTAYFLLAMLLLRFFYSQPKNTQIETTFLTATLLGILLEIMQIFTGREFDFLDMAANSLGAGCFCLLYKKYFDYKIIIFFKSGC
ncbi:VanZ family protein [Candidatus Uabimicrobium sp. HlEnr_7]|uniref:VanZ family protein n=1 Tax=Candidatus Uabimicrobium helgolandensis TaxID=3095367 RepID=UPI00355680BF